MPFLSGTLRFWSGDDEPTEVQLDQLEFVFFDSWEPSLIVEEWYVAQINGRRVRYGEFDGMARGLTLRVEGAEHASLTKWGRASTAAGEPVPQPDFTDTHTLEVR